MVEKRETMSNKPHKNLNLREKLHIENLYNSYYTRYSNIQKLYIELFKMQDMVYKYVSLKTTANISLFTKNSLKHSCILFIEVFWRIVKNPKHKRVGAKLMTPKRDIGGQN